MNAMIASAESPYYADAMYARELKARRDRVDERRRRDLERQKQKQRQGQRPAERASSAIAAAPAPAPAAVFSVGQQISVGAEVGATQQLERLFRAAEQHTQRESEARLEQQRRQQLKEAVANRRAAAKTFSVVPHRHPREVDQEHIALLKRRFRCSSPPDSHPSGPIHTYIHVYIPTAGWRT